MKNLKNIDTNLQSKGYSENILTIHGQIPSIAMFVPESSLLLHPVFPLCKYLCICSLSTGRLSFVCLCQGPRQPICIMHIKPKQAGAEMCQDQVQLVQLGQLGQLYLHQLNIMLRHTIVDSLLCQSTSCVHFLLNHYFFGMGGVGCVEKFKIKAKLSRS